MLFLSYPLIFIFPKKNNLCKALLIYYFYVGGYAYRLCKVPEDGIPKITEDCFQNGHLDFAKKKNSYVFHLPSGESAKIWDPNTSWIERTIVTTRHGTKPDNSEWAKINLPGLYRIEGGKIIDVPRTDYSDSNWKCNDLCKFTKLRKNN